MHDAVIVLLGALALPLSVYVSAIINQCQAIEDAAVRRELKQVRTRALALRRARCGLHTTYIGETTKLEAR